MEYLNAKCHAYSPPSNSQSHRPNWYLTSIIPPPPPPPSKTTQPTSENLSLFPFLRHVSFRDGGREGGGACVGGEMLREGGGMFACTYTHTHYLYTLTFRAVDLCQAPLLTNQPTTRGHTASQGRRSTFFNGRIRGGGALVMKN